jgi:1-acyl-sn-glycerol-3-phosphate acyltransferase
MLFFLRAVIATTYVLVFFGLCFFAVIFRPFNPNNTHDLGKIMGSLGLKLLNITFTYSKSDQLNTEQPCVYVMNHQDYLDVLYSCAIIQKRTVIVGKKSLKWIPFLGTTFWLAGNILIDRGNRSSALSTLDTTVAEIKEKRLSILIFPEGSRNRGKGLQPFKKGAFLTAIKAGIPIVPLCISSNHKNLNLKQLKSGTSLGEILPPISTIGLTEDDAQALATTTFNQMKNCIDRLDEKLASNSTQSDSKQLT